MIELKDRVPTKPNRKLIMPESGGSPYYATVINADEPVETGTPINKATLNQIGISEYSYSKSENTHILTGSGDNIKFIPTSDFITGDIITVNGATVIPIDNMGEIQDEPFKANIVQNATLQGDKLVFKIGGGIYGTLSPQIKNFTAKAGNHQITLNWTNPNDSNHAGTYIVRKQGSMPTKLSDGIKIDVGKATSYTDREPENYKLYYYRAFTYNAKKQVQTELTGAVVSGMPKSTRIMTVKINLNESNPEACCTYADDAVGMTPKSQEWDDFFGHKPCLFKNGSVVGYLNPNDFTKLENGSSADITSGNSGDVMIEFPRRGLKIETVNNIITISMTDAQDDTNFEYLAHTRGSTKKEKFYLGVYKGYVSGGKLRSLSNKTPTANQTIGTFRTQAQSNGTGYEQSAFYQLTYRQAMYVLKYKNLDSQTSVGRGYVDGNSAATATGGTETKGMDWGETTGKQHMKLFGIEDFWGNVYEWIDGIVTNSTRNMLTATDGFNDAGTGYVDQGQGATANIGNYMSKPQGTTKTGFLAKEVSGSETTYFCDSATLYASRVAYFGGDWNYASTAGAFRLGVVNASSSSDAYIAARLMYL